MENEGLDTLLKKIMGTRSTDQRPDVKPKHARTAVNMTAVDDYDDDDDDDERMNFNVA